MKIDLLKSSIALASITLIVGCGGSGDSNNTSAVSSTTLPSVVQAAIDGSKSILSQELTNTLAFMGNEERLAYDVYNFLYAKFATTELTNIAQKSEYMHITAVQGLVQKYALDDSVAFSNVDLPPLGYINTPIESMRAGVYDISEIQDLYDSLTVQGSNSEIDALKVGCIVEVVDVNDLNEDIALAASENASDVLTVFNFLRDGSYSHYWAFDEALKSRAISDGCCSLGTTYCHPEYPKK